MPHHPHHHKADHIVEPVTGINKRHAARLHLLSQESFGFQCKPGPLLSPLPYLNFPPSPSHAYPQGYLLSLPPHFRPMMYHIPSITLLAPCPMPLWLTPSPSLLGSLYIISLSSSLPQHESFPLCRPTGPHTAKGSHRPYYPGTPPLSERV